MKWKSKDVTVAKLIEDLHSATACITLPFLQLLYFLLSLIYNITSFTFIPLLNSFSRFL